MSQPPSTALTSQAFPERLSRGVVELEVAVPRHRHHSDLEAIDSELRLLAIVRRGCREHGGMVPSIGPVDEVLNKRCELTGLRRLTKCLLNQ